MSPSCCKQNLNPGPPGHYSPSLIITATTFLCDEILIDMALFQSCGERKKYFSAYIVLFQESTVMECIRFIPFELFFLWQLVEAALAEYPENLHLMYVRASLEEVVYGGEVALHTARQMFTLWQKLYKEQLMTDISDVQSQHHANHDTHSMFNLSDKDTGMAYTSSVFYTTSFPLYICTIMLNRQNKWNNYRARFVCFTSSVLTLSKCLLYMSSCNCCCVVAVKSSCT